MSVFSSCHPTFPELLATGSGQRHFAVSLTADISDAENVDSDSDDDAATRVDNSVKIWRFG